MRFIIATSYSSIKLIKALRSSFPEFRKKCEFLESTSKVRDHIKPFARIEPTSKCIDIIVWSCFSSLKDTCHNNQRRIFTYRQGFDPIFSPRTEWIWQNWGRKASIYQISRQVWATSFGQFCHDVVISHIFHTFPDVGIYSGHMNKIEIWMLKLYFLFY